MGSSWGELRERDLDVALPPRVRIAGDPDEMPEDDDAPMFPMDKAEALERLDGASKEIRARAHQLIQEGLEPGEWYELFLALATAIEGLAALLERIPTPDEAFSMLSDFMVGHAPEPAAAQPIRPDPGTPMVRH